MRAIKSYHVGSTFEDQIFQTKPSHNIRPTTTGPPSKGTKASSLVFKAKAKAKGGVGIKLEVFPFAKI